MENPFEIINNRLDRIEEMISILSRNVLSSPSNDLANKPEIQEKLSITELAAYLKCSKVTIHNYKKSKKFPYYGTGKLTFFKRSEVDAALLSQVKTKKK